MGVLLEVPHYNQLHDPGMYGTRDWLWYQDCGEQCDSMVLAATGGPVLDEATIRQSMPNHTDSGLTTGAENVAFLHAHGIPCRDVFLGGWPAIGSVKTALTEGKPSIWLGRWVSDAFLHWIVVRGRGGGMCTFNDPWGGAVRVMPWPWMLAKSAGEYVAIERAVPHTAVAS